MNCTDYHDLQEDIAEAEKEVVAAKNRLANAQAWLAELQANVPPFKEGQYVRVSGRGGMLLVQGCEKAFGEWVVKGSFPSDNYKSYYYPANMLVADDDDALPF